MKASKVPIYDYGTLQNALFMGNNPPPVPGWVSFKVVWQGGVTMMPVTSTDPTKGIFSGTFATCTAQMEWQAAAGDFTFQSDPLETSQSTVCRNRSGDQRFVLDWVETHEGGWILPAAFDPSRSSFRLTSVRMPGGRS